MTLSWPDPSVHIQHHLIYEYHFNIILSFTEVLNS